MIHPDELTVAEAAATWGVSRVRAWRIIKAYQAQHRYVHPMLIALPRAEVERIAALERRRGGRGRDRRPRRRA